MTSTVRCLVAGLCSVGTAIVALPPPVATAATASLSRLGSISRPLTGMYATTGTREAFSSPAVGDVTGDGRVDLVAAALDGVVEAYTLPGRARIWSVSLGRTAIQTSPALGDLTGDGRVDVVVGTMDGRIVVLDGPTGRIVRTLSQGPPLHCPPGQDCRPDGFFASPALADLNGDGRLDVVAASWDHSIYAWSGTGPLLWRRFLEDTVWSSPAVADIDRDGAPEVIVGGDIYPGNNLGVPAGGLVWVLARNGSVRPGYPRSIPGQTVWSSPAVGDVNRDGWPEIVVGTGTNSPDPAGRRVYAFTAATRRDLPGWPVAVDGRAMGSPALGNLDGDPQLEVVATSEPGHVYGFDTSGRRLWTCPNCAGAHSSASIADVDADGQQEVVAAGDHELKVLSGSGAVEARAALATGGWAPAVAPAIAEVDGRTVIVTTKSDTALAIDLFSTGKALCSADWPVFRGDARRRGNAVGAGSAGWTPFGCPSDFVAQQYKDFLGRPLDAAGLGYWTGQLRGGSPGSALIESFMGSPEFGRVVAPVVRANFALWGTFPRSAAAVRQGAASLRTGEPLATVVGRLAADPALTALTDDAFVQRVYRNLYGRAPSGTELAAARSRIQGAGGRGAFTADHAEFAAARLAPQVNVTMTYLGMLDRTPDGAGFAFWVPQARAGGIRRLIAGFQGSSEYRNRVT